MTLLLAVAFTSAQAFEYWNIPFNLSYTLFRDTFFSITGIHGIHVIVGSIMILISLIRIIKKKINRNFHRGLELSI